MFIYVLAGCLCIYLIHVHFPVLSYLLGLILLLLWLLPSHWVHSWWFPWYICFSMRLYNKYVFLHDDLWIPLCLLELSPTGIILFTVSCPSGWQYGKCEVFGYPLTGLSPQWHLCHWPFQGGDPIVNLSVLVWCSTYSLMNGSCFMCVNVLYDWEGSVNAIVPSG